MSQGISSLYRTGLAPTDPNFIPSAEDRNDYAKQVGQQAPDHDPTQPNKFWWDPAAVKLPPEQAVTYLLYNGSLTAPALDQTTMPAARAAVVNIPGDITYPVWKTPTTTATWRDTAVGTPTPLPGIYLSTQEDANALANMIPGSKIITGQEAYPGGEFILNGQPYPANERLQPFVIVLPSGGSGFAGVAIDAMYRPHGKGAPCHWVLNASGFYDLVFDLPTDSPSSATLAVPCDPVPTGYELVSVDTGIIPTVEILPIGGTITGPTMTLSPDFPGGGGTFVLTPVVAGRKSRMTISGKIAANCPNCGKPRTNVHAGGVLVATSPSQCAACGTQF